MPASRKRGHLSMTISTATVCTCTRMPRTLRTPTVVDIVSSEPHVQSNRGTTAVSLETRPIFQTMGSGGLQSHLLQSTLPCAGVTSIPYTMCDFSDIEHPSGKDGMVVFLRQSLATSPSRVRSTIVHWKRTSLPTIALSPKHGVEFSRT